jgi:hypothetical protein
MENRLAGLWEAGKLGSLPAFSVILSAGLMIIALAFRGSLSQAVWAEGVFWTGLLVLLLPVSIRLILSNTTRTERVGLIALLGLSLYLVKIMHSPTAFTFSDELVHEHNVNEVLRSRTLFGSNSILEVTPLYPGLSIVTAALASFTGLTSFAAGVFVIGAARLINVLGLYLLYEYLSRSGRIAAVAAILYMANSNFLFWSAQFAYESLALPLAILILFLLVYYREMFRSGRSWGTYGSILLLMSAVVVTHHITSYILIAFLFLLAFIDLLLKFWYFDVPKDSLILALAASALTGLWLFGFARPTLDYLLPVILNTIRSVGGALFGNETDVRQLFQSSGGFMVPIWERVIGLTSAVLILFGIPLGLLHLWNRYRRSAIALSLAAAALLFFPIQSLRFTGGGWETANRSSEFLFVGIAFVLALFILVYWLARPAAWKIMLVTAYIAVVFIGGVISGWSPDVRLARPYSILARDSGNKTRVIAPPGFTIARWTRDYLGTGHRIATDPSNARMLQLYGDQVTLAGSRYGVGDLLLAPQIGRGEQEILQTIQVDYVALALPLARWDQMSGVYFLPSDANGGSPQVTIPKEAYEKFDLNERISRILDSGDVLVYYVGGLNGKP